MFNRERSTLFSPGACHTCLRSWKVHILLSNRTVSFNPTVRGYSFNLLSASRAGDLDTLQLQHSFADYLGPNQTSHLSSPPISTRLAQFFLLAPFQYLLHLLWICPIPRPAPFSVLPSLPGLEIGACVFSYTGYTLYKTFENQVDAACRIAGTFLPRQ